MTDERSAEQIPFAEIGLCRERLHRMIDERLDGLLLRLILGEQADALRAEGDRLVPFASPPAVLKGTKPSAVILRRQEVPASTWKKVTAAVLRDCAADPECLERMLDLRGKIHGNFRALLSDRPDGMGAPLEICEGLYWESKFDTEALLRNLTEKLLDAVGYDYRRVVIRCRRLRGAD